MEVNESCIYCRPRAFLPTTESDDEMLSSDDDDNLHVGVLREKAKKKLKDSNLSKREKA